MLRLSLNLISLGAKRNSLSRSPQKKVVLGQSQHVNLKLNEIRSCPSTNNDMRFGLRSYLVAYHN